MKDPEDETFSIKKFDEWGWSKNNALEVLGAGCNTKSELDVWRDYRFEGKSTVLNFMDFADGSEVKNGPALQETQVRSLGRKHSLEKEMTIHSSILASRIQQTEEYSRLQSIGLQKGWTCLHD